MAGDLTVRLVAVEYGAAGINRYRFAPLGGTVLPSFEPGAHIDVRIETDVVKQYSLIWSADDTGHYEIAVRAGDRHGSASRRLHDESVVGSEYRISMPRNNFGIAGGTEQRLFTDGTEQRLFADNTEQRLVTDNTEHHLFAGGIGITPLISMYRWLTAAKTPVRLDYWTTTAERMLFRDELGDAPGVSLFTTADGSAPRLADRIPGVPDHAHLYCCGPPAMVDEFDRLTADRDPGLVHRERFTAPADDRPADTCTVTLYRSGRVLTVPADRSILEICCEAGIDAEYSCEEGVCGACEVKVLGGTVDHRDSVLTPAERAGHDRMMICCSRGRGDLVIDL